MTLTFLHIEIDLAKGLKELTVSVLLYKKKYGKLPYFMLYDYVIFNYGSWANGIQIIAECGRFTVSRYKFVANNK